MAVKLMNLRNTQSNWSVKSLVMAATIVTCATLAPGAAQAGQMSQGWNYSIDSFKDGTEYSTIGQKSAFEFYGIAFREYKNKVVFAINSNLAPAGYTSSRSLGGAIGYGDLMINFGDSTLAKAEGTSNLYGVDFTKNDTNFATGSGLYKNVTTKSLTTQNEGYHSIQQHTTTVSNLKGKASFGDMAADTTYFNKNAAARTHIASGNYAGGVTMIDSFSDKSKLDFGKFGATGKYTFGFSVDKSKLQTGNFVASLFAECGNDGVVLNGKILGDSGIKSVPESSPLAGLAVVGMVGGALALRKRQQAKLIA